MEKTTTETHTGSSQQSLKIGDVAKSKSLPSAIEHVAHQGELFGIVIRAYLPHEGYNFVSDPDDSLQVGVNHYTRGDIVKPHYHLPVDRSLKNTLEVLHIDSGKCILTFYDHEQRAVHRSQLNEGDTVILMSGGHGLEILGNTRIVEIKQGPYLGREKDKAFFEGIYE